MERRKRRTKRGFLPEIVPERLSPSDTKGSAFTLATAQTQGLYSTKDRIGKILSFCDLNAKMVEPRGVEPLSCDVIMTISTCLFCLYCFSSSGFADRQAAFRLAHLKSRTQTDE